MQEYMKARKEDPVRSAKNKQQGIEARRRLRKLREGTDLCTDCGKPKERKELRLCDHCNDIMVTASIKHRRKAGMKPAGKSQYQELALKILKILLPDYSILYNDRRTIRNPLTHNALELDIYIPDIRTAFEIDGPMHREPVYGEKRYLYQIAADAIKDEQCTLKDIKLIRISTEDIINNGESWLRKTLSEAIQMAA
jgi:hypothetical protein